MSHTKKTNTVLSESDVAKIGILAKLPLSPSQVTELTTQLGQSVSYVSILQSLDTTGVTETSQVTGLENVYREDEIDPMRILSQEDALSNAKRTHNGFFVVDAVLNEE